MNKIERKVRSTFDAIGLPYDVKPCKSGQRFFIDGQLVITVATNHTARADTGEWRNTIKRFLNHNGLTAKGHF